MDAVNRHAYEPDVSFDGGDLDCGSGLLLLIRQHIVLLTPDCGFATFADNPVASAQVAEGKLLAISRAAEILSRG